MTLVVPNFNHATYLPETLAALLAQTRPADEILVVDDGSTDDSVAVIEATAATHARVRLLRNTRNLGVVAALNAGLAQASGDLIAFLGADDRIGPTFVERLAGALESAPEAGFACGRAAIHDAGDRRTGTRPIVRPANSRVAFSAGDARAQLAAADNFFLGAVLLYRKSAVQALGGFDARLRSLSDGILQRRLAVRYGYCFVPDVLGVWRVHGENYSVASVTAPETLDAMLAASRAVLYPETPALFPPGYPEVFDRRLRFNAARLLIADLGHTSETAARINATIRGTVLDRCVLSIATLVARLPMTAPLARLSVTGWLVLRLAPLRMSWLLREAFWRFTDRMNAPR